MAEIELLLSIIFFITILMLTRSAVRLALARLETSHDAQQQAFEDATANSPPQFADDSVAPVTGYSGMRGGLPNRMHVSRPVQDVTIYTGDKQPLPPFTVGASAAVPGPGWAFSGYPAASDRDLTQGWFESYADESHGQVMSPLGLAPAWTP